jgi:hypothetical protein
LRRKQEEEREAFRLKQVEEQVQRTDVWLVRYFNVKNGKG